ncbi:Integrase core domain [Labeo rohita]|nr:Integrase core domain [Labeo rohita]
MGRRVEILIASCVTCQLNDKTAKPVPLIPVELPSSAWEKIAIDIMGPFEAASWDCHYAITLVDYFSKWPEVAFAPQVTADAVTNFLDTVFSREGNPHCLVSDNGPQLTSNALADFLKECDIQHTYSSVYYPQANGTVERFNLVLKQCIQSAIQEKKPWKSAVTVFAQLPGDTTCYNRGYAL